MAVFDQLIAVIEAAGRQDADAKTRYAAQLQSLKNNRKRAAGELEGLLRSDAKAQRAQDEQAMLAVTDALDLQRRCAQTFIASRKLSVDTAPGARADGGRLRIGCVGTRVHLRGLHDFA